MGENRRQRFFVLGFGCFLLFVFFCFFFGFFWVFLFGCFGCLFGFDDYYCGPKRPWFRDCLLLFEASEANPSLIAQEESAMNIEICGGVIESCRG